MANHKSALKRARQNEKRRTRNQHNRTAARSAAKDALTQIQSAKTREEALKALLLAEKNLQKASTKGALPKTRVSRKVSRLAALVNKKFSAQSQPAH